MAPPSEHAAAVVARLDGVVALHLTVIAAQWILPGLRGLRAEGDLSGFDPFAGQDLMVPAQTDAGPPRWRRYTVRRIDRAAGTIELWVTTDSEGPGARWALDAAPGDMFEAVGPRGKVGLDGAATHHVFAVDASGLAAAAAMADAAGPAGTSRLTALVDDAQLRTAADGLPNSGEFASLTERGFFTSPERFDADVRAAVIDAVEDPGVDDLAVYVFSELRLMRRITAMLGELGLDPARVRAKPYWRAGQANQDHGEPDKSI